MQIQSSLAQGLRLLGAAVDRERSGLSRYTASRLAEATEIERSRASRLTKELRSLRYLERDGEQTFRAGTTFLAAAAVLNEPVLRAARAELRALAAAYRATARVTARDGAQAILLRYEHAAGGVEASVRPGMVTPVWATGSGRALLWDHDRAALDALLADVQFVGVGGPGAARSVAEVDERMARDRRDGAVWASGEFDEGVDEAAFPIRDGDGRIVAALSASLPTGATGRDSRSALIESVRTAAERLSATGATRR